MRIIGIKLGVCNPLVRKALKDDTWYPFGNYYEPTEANGWEWRSPEQKQQEEACRQMYKAVEGTDIKEKLDITVNCIVGKNGSGKSSLLDIYYRIINNFAWKLIDQLWFDNTPDKNPQRGHHLTEACGFDATLYYETDGCVGSLRYNYGSLEMSYHSDVDDATWHNGARHFCAVSNRDVLVNIIGFIPVGLLAGLLSKRYRVPKALLAGLLLSLSVECSRLLWSRGVFDVDDIFNNSLGALLGGVIAMCLLRIRKPINGTGRHIRR